MPTVSRGAISDTKNGRWERSVNGGRVALDPQRSGNWTDGWRARRMHDGEHGPVWRQRDMRRRGLRSGRRIFVPNLEAAAASLRLAVACAGGGTAAGAFRGTHRATADTRHCRYCCRQHQQNHSDAHEPAHTASILPPPGTKRAALGAALRIPEGVWDLRR
jgi:hypothetical protein